MRTFLSAAFAAAVVVLVQATPAEAVAFLTFVSATGNDANPCTAQANPCKTLQRAINVTSAGGEIRILSNLPAQIATVGVSLNIDGGGNAMIGALAINAASGVVGVRNLNLTGRGVLTIGINIQNAAAVHIENCTTERFTQDGIRIASNLATEVYVADSVSRDNGSIGLVVFQPTSVKLTVDNSRFENNAVFGLSIAGGHASVSRSVASGNDDGFVALGGKMAIFGTTASSNADKGFNLEGGVMTLTSSTAQSNDTGLFVGSGLTARASASVLSNNTSFGIGGTGLVETDGTNVVDGNGTDVAGGITTQAINLE